MARDYRLLCCFGNFKLCEKILHKAIQQFQKPIKCGKEHRTLPLITQLNAVKSYLVFSLNTQKTGLTAPNSSISMDWVTSKDIRRIVITLSNENLQTDFHYRKNTGMYA